MKVIVTEYVFDGNDEKKTTLDIPDITVESLKKAAINAIFKTENCENYKVCINKDDTLENVYHITSVKIKCKIAGRYTSWVPFGIFGKIELI